MKTILISFLTLLLYLQTKAQSNFYKLSLGAGYGFTQSFTDLPAHNIGKALYGNADFFFTPFVSLGGELQMGKIKGGTKNMGSSEESQDPNGRLFINSYKAATINGKLYLGALIDYDRSAFAKTIRWLYAGAGAGIIHNRMDTINRKKPDGSGHIFPGLSASNNLLVPLNLGINFYFQDYSGTPKFAINVNFQSNVTFGEGLDGYDDSPIRFRNGNPDIYNYLSVGIKYNFGLIGLSKKSLF